MKKALKGLGIALAAMAVILAAAGFKLSRDAQAALAALPHETIDMGRVADGMYPGEADAGLVFVRVSVEVQDHAVRDIRILEHKNGRGGAAEAITAAMVAANSWDVNAVSGATLSSEAIKSAVSKALKQGED